MIAIRQAETSDIQQIQAVASAAWLATYKELYSLDFIHGFIGRAYSQEQLSGAIERDHLEPVPLFLVAINEEGQLIGYAHIQPEGDRTYELLRLYVRPDHQRSGAGSLLLQEYLMTLTSMISLFAWVERDNAIGRAFYEQKGFVPTEKMLETMAGHTTVLVRYELRVGGDNET